LIALEAIPSVNQKKIVVRIPALALLLDDSHNVVHVFFPIHVLDVADVDYVSVCGLFDLQQPGVGSCVDRLDLNPPDIVFQL